MEFRFILLSPLLVWSTPLGAFPGNVVYACTNIQQVASDDDDDDEEEEEEEEKEGGTPHVDTWCNARVWVDFFGGLH